MIVCSRCGKENQEHYKFCLGCGAELPRHASKPKSFVAPELEDTESSVVNEGATASSRARGGPAAASAAQIDVDSSLPRPSAVPLDDLPRELAPLADDTSPCSNCGAYVPVNFRFCHVCGNDLHAETGFVGSSSDAPAERVSAPAVAEPRPEVRRASLVLIQPDGSEGEAFPLSAGRTLIGRSVGGVFANDAYLSPEHAELRFEDDQLVVRDLESLNGVYIRIEPDLPIELFDGTIFRIGQEVLRFEAPVAPEPEPDGTQHMGSPHHGFLGRISLVIGRHTTGNSYPVPPQGIHLGRERGDVLFPEDGYVSGLHCRIHSEVGHVFLTDVGSSNGTFVRVSNESFVPKGTYVLMGQQLFRADY